MKKRYLLFIIVLILSIVLYSNSFAAPTSRAFVEVYGDWGYENARSPARNANLTDNYVRVTQKCNQARNIGTSPHQGTDMTMSAGTVVYPIFPGRVVSLDQDTSDQLGYVVINSDIDYDGTVDNYYIRYTHINPNNNLQVNTTWLTSNTSMGVIDTEKPGGYSPHLHISWQDTINGYEKKLFKFFTYCSTYNYGRDFDVFTGDDFVDNIFFINGYTKAGDTRSKLTKIELYYKVGNNNWSSTPVLMSYQSNYYYEYDLSSLPGVQYGSVIKFYIVGYRNVTGYDNWSVWPMYYEHPPIKP
ncbi:MAG: hypothetical protein GX625_11695, partial [Clostridiaceae bacterium]|nr:hypothetical protein [Clostridiaceae bacterium]